MAVDFTTFNAKVHAESVQRLLELLAKQDIRLTMSATEFERMLINVGMVAMENNHCLAAASVHLAVGAKEADLVFAVDPYADSGIRSRLISEAVGMGRDCGAASLIVYLADNDSVNREILASSGAIEVSGYRRWTVQLGKRPLNCEPTPIRFEETVDVQKVIVAAERAWGDLPGHKPATRQAVIDALEAFGPGSHIVAMNASGRPIGLVRSILTSPTEGYVDAPGLAPGWREAELYAAVVSKALQQLVDRGALSAVMDSWGDPPNAVHGWALAGWQLESVAPAFRILV